MVMQRIPSKCPQLLPPILQIQKLVFEGLVPPLTNKLARIAVVALPKSPHLLANAMTQRIEQNEIWTKYLFLNVIIPFNVYLTNTVSSPFLQFDFQQLPVSVLRRYRRHFNLHLHQTKRSNKTQLAVVCFSPPALLSSHDISTTFL